MIGMAHRILKYKAVICPFTGQLRQVDHTYRPKPQARLHIINDKMGKMLVHPFSTPSNIIATESKSKFDEITRLAGYECVGNEYDNYQYKAPEAEQPINWKEEVSQARQTLTYDFGGKLQDGD